MNDCQRQVNIRAYPRYSQIDLILLQFKHIWDNFTANHFMSFDMNYYEGIVYIRMKIQILQGIGCTATGINLRQDGKLANSSLNAAAKELLQSVEIYLSPSKK